MKILIVDDDKMMLKAIGHSLMNDGYEVMVAEDGYNALDMITRSKIDLVITDVMMPNISGLGLLSLLKQFYFNKIPVILISSLNKADVIVSFGADFLGTWISGEEFSRAASMSCSEKHPFSIQQCCATNFPLASGFRWKFPAQTGFMLAK